MSTEEKNEPEENETVDAPAASAAPDTKPKAPTKAKDPKPPKPRAKKIIAPDTMYVTVENPKKDPENNPIIIPGDFAGKNNIFLRKAELTIQNSPRIKKMIETKKLKVSANQIEAVVQTRTTEEAIALRDKTRRKRKGK